MAVTTAAVVGGVASAASAYSSIKSANAGGKGGGGPPKWQTDNNKRLAQQAQGMNREIAGFTDDQLAAQQGIRDIQGMGQEDMLSAQRFAEGLRNGVSADDIRAFYNPYEQDVINAYEADAARARGTANLEVNQRAEASKAFGGDREAILRGTRLGSIDDAMLGDVANLRYSGYQSATNNAFRNWDAMQSGNAQVMDIINSRRGAGYQDLLALDASGRQQQSLQQSINDAPMETLRFRSDINNAGNYGQAQGGGTFRDPIAGGLDAFQGGVRGVQGAIDAWRTMFPGEATYSNYDFGWGSSPMRDVPLGVPTVGGL